MKLDLHIHSRFSRDGSAEPRDILRQCKKAGMDGCAIADHNSLEGSLEAFSIAGSEGMVVLRAVEVSTSEGHVLAYGIDEPVPRGLDVAETIERVHSLGGIAVAAHPHRFPSGVGLKIAKASSFDAIEVLNGGSSSRSNRLAGVVAFNRKLPVTGGSDAHEIERVGRAYTEFEGASDEGDLIDSIRKGKTSVGGVSRSFSDSVRYSYEILIEWAKAGFKRL